MGLLGLLLQAFKFTLNCFFDCACVASGKLEGGFNLSFSILESGSLQQLVCIRITRNGLHRICESLQFGF